MPDNVKFDAYDELASYTLAHPNASYFIHQHIVDAFALETADEYTKPIKITFALVGLYLFLEKHFSGRQVQRAHMVLAKNRRQWPSFPVPKTRGSVTIADVLAVAPGEARDDKIRDWCMCVWTSWKESQQSVRDLVKEELEI